MSMWDLGAWGGSALGDREVGFRDWLLARLMKVSVVIGMLLFLLWIPSVISRRLFLQGAAMLGLYGLFLVLALAKSWSSTVRCNGLLLLLLSSGAFTLAQNGLVGQGRFWLILVPVLAMLLTGRRGAWLWVLVSASVYALIAWAHVHGDLVPLQSPELTGPVSWLVGSVMPIVVVLVVTSVIWEYRAYLAASLVEMQHGVDVTYQLRLQSQVEAEQARRRADQIDRAASLSHSLVGIRDRDVLLRRLAEGMVETLGLYQANVFLSDSRGEQLALVAAAGAQGMELVDTGCTLPVGDASLPGRVARTGEPEFAMVDRDTRFPLRSKELALPMLFGGDLLGVLDVFGNLEPFTDDDMRVLGMVTDQVAATLSGLRLLEETTARAQELRELTMLTEGSSWRSLLKSALVAEDVQTGALPGPDVEAIVAQTLADGETHVVEIADGDKGWALAVPLRWRDTTIGCLVFTRLGKHGRPAGRWDQDAVELATVAAERLAWALDAERLSRDSRRKAQYQEHLSRLSDSIWSSPDVESVMRNGVRELGVALDASEVILTFSPRGSGAEVSPQTESSLRPGSGEEVP